MHLLQDYSNGDIRFVEEGEDRPGSDGLDGYQPHMQLQHMWIVQQYCNRGTLYDALDR